MSDPKPIPEPTCWHCLAPNDPGASECWLCQRRDWRKYPGARARSPVPARGPLSTIAGMMALIAVIGVAAALFRDAPGLSVLLFISIVPALLITEWKARRRRRRGETMSATERVVWIIALTIVMPILIGVAVVAAMFAYCTLMNR